MNGFDPSFCYPYGNEKMMYRQNLYHTMSIQYCINYLTSNKKIFFEMKRINSITE